MILLDTNNKLVAENAALLKRWTEYFKDLYNYKIRPDNNLLKPNKINSNEDSLPILESEVRNAILTLKNGKSPGPDNIPSEEKALSKYLQQSVSKYGKQKSGQTNGLNYLLYPSRKKLTHENVLITER